MTPQDILRELEPLDHKDRVRYMIELGRRVAENAPAAGSIRQILQALEGGDFYQRYMALYACQGSRDSDQALRALSDPSRIIRGLAIELVVVLCYDAQVLAGLSGANFEIRRVLLTRLWKRQRQAVIDAFLDQLDGQPEEEPAFLRLLGFGSAALVEKYQARLENATDRADWARLAKIHPDLAANLLQNEVSRLTSPDHRLLKVVNRALPWLSLYRPDRALELARSSVGIFGLGQLSLNRLVTQRPIQLADLVLASPEKTRLNFDEVLGRLDTGRLIRLLAWPGAQIGRRNNWLKYFAPPQRQVIYEALHMGWRQTDGTIPIAILDWLPTGPREAEARRILALPALATSPKLRLSYAGYLPWEEARAIMLPFLNHPEPELRAAAHSGLAKTVYYHPQFIPEELAIVRSKRNEQDPVRLTMLYGLANLPPGKWKADHLTELGKIIQDALNASDLSHQTAGNIERLIIKMLRNHSEWAAGWLATVVQQQGTFSYYGLQQQLNEQGINRIKASLLPVMERWVKQGREQQVIAAARSFGRLLKNFDEMVQILINVLKNTHNQAVATNILTVLTKYRPDSLAKLIPALLADDASWSAFQPVYLYLHRRRQDLLTPYLGQKAFKGRFSAGKNRLVLSFGTGFQRWTPAQQAVFAGTLSEVAREEMRDYVAIYSAIEQLQAMPGAGAAELIELAGDIRPNVRDKAIRSLGRLDAGEGIPKLVQMLNDERARVAVYALRRSLLDMPITRALAIIRSIPMNKVTVAKEVLRLLGDLRHEAAYRELLAIASEQLHPNNRVAALHGLWSYLDKAETWPILKEAAADPDPTIAGSLARIPSEGLSTTAEDRLVGLLADLLKHPDAEVRSAVLTRCAATPVNDRAQTLLPGLTASLESPLPGEYTLAVNAISATYYGQDSELIGRLTQRILPRRQVLQLLVENMRDLGGARPQYYLPTVRVVLETLAKDSLTAELQVRLAVPMLDFDELAQFLEGMAGRGEMHEAVVMAAVHALEKEGLRPDTAGLAALETRLAASSDPRLRRLALAALIGRAGSPQGWDEASLQQLQVYRNDPAPLVAAAAQFTFPPGLE